MAWCATNRVDDVFGFARNPPENQDGIALPGQGKREITEHYLRQRRCGYAMDSLQEEFSTW
jgi:hypothetical protein